MHIYYNRVSQSRVEEEYTIDLKNTRNNIYNVMNLPLMQNYLMNRNEDTMEIYTLADGVEKRVFDECMKKLKALVIPKKLNFPSNLTNIISSYAVPMAYVDGKIKISVKFDKNKLIVTDKLNKLVHHYVENAHEILSNGASTRRRNVSRRARSRNSSRSQKYVSPNSSKGRANRNLKWRQMLKKYPRMMTANTHSKWRNTNNLVPTKWTKTGKPYGNYSK